MNSGPQWKRSVPPEKWLVSTNRCVGRLGPIVKETEMLDLAVGEGCAILHHAKRKEDASLSTKDGLAPRHLVSISPFVFTKSHDEMREIFHAKYHSIYIKH